MKVNILGTEYSVVETDKEHDKYLEDCDGYCDKTTKQIVITTKTEESDLHDWDWYRKKILRHEIVHAFFLKAVYKKILKASHLELWKHWLIG